MATRRPRRSTVDRPFARAALLALLALGTAAQARAQDTSDLDGDPVKGIGRRTGVVGALVLEDPHRRFDPRHQFATVEERFAVRNGGSTPVTITEVLSITADAELSIEPRVLAPGAVATVSVTQPLADALGRTAFRYALISDEPEVARYRFSLSGFVESAFDPELPAADFGVVVEGGFGEARVELASREVPRLEVLGLVDPPAGLELAAVEGSGLGAEGVALRLRLTASELDVYGLTGGVVDVRTNVPRQPRVRVTYRAVHGGPVLPAATVIQLGAVEQGQTVRRTVELRSRDGGPLELSADDPEGLLAVSLQPCAGAPEDPSCRLLVVELAPTSGHPAAPVAGFVRVWAATPVAGSATEAAGSATAGKAKALRLPYSGLVMRPGTQLRSLTVPDAAPAGAGATPPAGAGVPR